MLINKFSKVFLKNKFYYLSLLLLLVIAVFLRVYRVDKILGFYFDQGRDALVIWNFWNHGKFFLVGPTTGIAGIFRGPYYYYLIAPIYLIGGGNPVFPAVFLALLSVVALAVMCYLAIKTDGKTAGLISLFIGTFSLYIVLASRWLSNPTPMLLLSMIVVGSMFLILQRKSWAWVVLSLTAGLSLSSFGSAGEIFYFPAILIFFLWQAKRKNLPSVKIVILSAVFLLVTVLPQILFDIRHDGILRKNVAKFLVEDESFKTSFSDVFLVRMNFYYDVFTSKIFHERKPVQIFFLSTFAYLFIFFWKKLKQNDYFLVLCLLFIAPVIGLLFFQGNYGNIYDYYLTGYYLIFILIFSIVFAQIRYFRFGYVFLGLFLYAVFINNVHILRPRLTDGVDGPNTIGFKNQLQALDWIYDDAQGIPFSTDVYVPPVIPYAYEYLFLWYGGEVRGYTPSTQIINPLYTLYEVDPPHPERLTAWLKRQEGIGTVEEEVQFGGIVVQRRVRK